MARKSNPQAKATNFTKIDYDVYCRLKRGFSGWGGTADQVPAIKRVVQRERANDNGTELLIQRAGLDVVVRSLRKLLRAKAFCKSTEFAKIFPDVTKWSAGSKAGLKAGEATAPTSNTDRARSTLESALVVESTGSRAETGPPPKGVQPAGVEASVHAPRGRADMSTSRRGNWQDKVLRPSGGGITKTRAGAVSSGRPRLRPDVPVVGNWNKRLLEPLKAENPVAGLVHIPSPPTKKDGDETKAVLTIEPAHISEDERRKIVEEAYCISRQTFFKYLTRDGGLANIEDPPPGWHLQVQE
ncbi:hypothetical protein TWF281_006522 [Arthrobotrys megalospora]